MSKEKHTPHESTYAAPERVRDLREIISDLRKTYPEAHLRDDGQFFIYDVVSADGKASHMHVHRWTHIPVQWSEDSIKPIPLEQVIDVTIRTYGTVPAGQWSLRAALDGEYDA